MKNLVPWSESESPSVVSDSLRPCGLFSPWNSPGQNTGVDSCSLLQGIFPTQGSNPGLLRGRQILYQLSHQGSPEILEWIAYPFSRGSSRPRNRTRVSCIAGRSFTSWATRKVPWLGMKPGPQALGVQSLDHWTTGEVPPLTIRAHNSHGTLTSCPLNFRLQISRPLDPRKKCSHENRIKFLWIRSWDWHTIILFWINKTRSFSLSFSFPTRDWTRGPCSGSTGS